MKSAVRRYLAAVFMLSMACCSQSPHSAKNIVLISIDTLRLDRMSLYGAARDTTPAISALAQRSVRFSNAFSPSPWTVPAHAAMLSGLYPSSLSPNPEAQFLKLAPLISATLRSRGYRTGGVTDGAMVLDHYGVNRGFDSFENGEVADVISWIGEEPEEPFFFFFHTYVTHIPYQDRRYVQAVDGGRLSTIYEGGPDDWLDLHLDVCCRSLKPTEEEKDFLLRLYDGGVAAADEMVGEIVASLGSTGLLDRTIVIVTSDHGEEFWDHTGRGAYHGHTLYNELLRIPLIWYEPDLPFPGTVSFELVSLVDIVPTILARLGLDVTPELDGLDLSPLLDGEAWVAERELFGEALRNGPQRRSVNSLHGKLIVTPRPDIQGGEGVLYPVPVKSSEELYLPDDLKEEHNRFEENPGLAKALAGRLREHLRSAAVIDPIVSEQPLDEATRERLEALGYVH